MIKVKIYKKIRHCNLFDGNEYLDRLDFVEEREFDNLNMLSNFLEQNENLTFRSLEEN